MADNKIVEEIFKTIDIITEHKLNATEYLYTEDCTIIAKTFDPFLYKVQHEQQEFDAHSPLGESFEIGQTVTVLFTDYSKITKKIILFGNATSKKLASVGAADSFFIEGSQSFYNGITYGNLIPTLKFSIDPTTPNNGYYYNLISDIDILNPVSNNAYSYTGIRLRGYFYDGIYGDVVCQIPYYLLITTNNNLTYAPISDRKTAALFNNYGNIEFFNTSNHTLDIGVGNSNYSLTRYFYNGGTGKQLIGSVGMSGMNVSYNTTSDYRLKENVIDLNSGLERIKSLRPVSWTWKNTEIKSEGFLAHEVQEVVPIAVTGEKDKRDYDGNPQYQQIDLARLIPTLVSAIKELSIEVSLLKEEIEKLKEGDTTNGP